MTSTELKQKIVEAKAWKDELKGRGMSDAWIMRNQLIASLETAFQLSKLNEAIESGATITIRPPDGRKFRA